MKNKKLSGTCALTGTEGAFVKAHIIPLALTRLSSTGEKYVEAEIGQRTKRRSNSWYDNSLVTRDGEDILEEIDTKGIELLRKNKLVWSGWEEGQKLIDSDLLPNGLKNAPYRALALPNASDLQLFFLSIVWRAAASNRPEFEKIKLTSSDLEEIRLRVCLKAPGSFQDYPIQLFQISSIGLPHNRTPLLEEKEIADSIKTPKETVEYVRVYLDGLVAHVHLPHGVCLSENYLKTCLKADEDTLVILHKFEDSRAHANIKELIETVSVEQSKFNVRKKKVSSTLNSLLSKITP